jgi:hypothetical protein
MTNAWLTINDGKVPIMSQTSNLTPSRSGALESARTPRETGFGDFCFGRILKSDRMKDRDWSWSSAMNIVQGTELAKNSQFVSKYAFEAFQAGEWTKEDFAANSSNTPFVELGGFVRYVSCYV